jgi:hypothetical protein
MTRVSTYAKSCPYIHESLLTFRKDRKRVALFSTERKCIAMFVRQVHMAKDLISEHPGPQQFGDLLTNRTTVRPRELHSGRSSTKVEREGRPAVDFLTQTAASACISGGAALLVNTAGLQLVPGVGPFFQGVLNALLLRAKGYHLQGRELVLQECATVANSSLNVHFEVTSPLPRMHPPDQ